MSSDIALRQQILGELEFEPAVDAAHIGVLVEDGVVTLTGYVRSYAERAIAEQVVARIEQSLGEKALVGVAQPRRNRPPFATTAKDIIRGALNQARSLRHKELTNEHLLLALAAHEGVAGQLLTAHGLSNLDIRAHLTKAG